MEWNLLASSLQIWPIKEAIFVVVNILTA